MTIRILEALDGVPLSAQCDDCGRVWHREDWDPRANELASWGRSHDCTHGGTR